MDKPNAEEKAGKPPSSMREAIEGTKAIIAERSVDPFADTSVENKPTEEKKAADEEPCEGCEEEKKAREEAAAKAKPKSRLFIVDEETGEKIPAVFNSEGKEYVPETMDTLKTWTGLGIHANKRFEEYKANEGIVKMILQAQKEGRLVIKDPVDGQPSEKETAPEPEEDDEVVTDPEVFKERQKRKALETEVKELKKNFQSLSKLVTMRQVNEVEAEIRSEIDANAKEFPLAKERKSEVWRLLAQVDDEGKPKYDTKSAMKIVHEASLKELRAFLVDHPEFVEKDKIKKEGVQEYLRQKEEKEKAPVASPSGLPSGKIEPEKEEIKGIHGAVEKMKTFLAAKKESGKSF